MKKRTRNSSCPDVDALKCLADQGVPMPEIWTHFGVGRKVLWRWMDEHSITRPMARFVPGIVRDTSNQTYSSWACMRTRVTNRKRQNSHRYVGRGIDCDPRWENFDNFLLDMGERPIGLTLDRIDNNRGYWPDNCRWTDRKLQVHNSARTFKTVIFRGRLMQVGQALEALGASWDDYRMARPRRGSTPQIAVDRLAAKLGKL